MQRIPVDSTCIASVGYEPGGQVLDVEFHRGRVYRHLNVPAPEAAALMVADSVGQHFNRFISRRYEFTIVRGESR